MLKKYFPAQRVGDIKDINYKNLWNDGIRLLMFDIEGTLTSSGFEASSEIVEFLESLCDEGFQIMFLCNEKEDQIRRFNAEMGFPFIAEAAKPSRWPFLKAPELLGLSKKEAVMIGDSPLTDIVGANRAGIRSILVASPATGGRRNFKRPFMEKLVFILYKIC